MSGTSRSVRSLSTETPNRLPIFVQHYHVGSVIAADGEADSHPATAVLGSQQPIRRVVCRLLKHPTSSLRSSPLYSLQHLRAQDEAGNQEDQWSHNRTQAIQGPFHNYDCQQ